MQERKVRQEGGSNMSTNNSFGTWYWGCTSKMSYGSGNTTAITVAPGFALPVRRWQSTSNPPAILPDDFDAFVEEVRRQHRIEELLTVLVDKCVSKEE